MAPIPSVSAPSSTPSLRGFMLSSPVLFWAVLSMILLLLLALVGWLGFKAVHYLRRSLARDGPVLPQYTTKDAPRPLLLSGMLSLRKRMPSPTWFQQLGTDMGRWYLSGIRRKDNPTNDTKPVTNPTFVSAPRPSAASAPAPAVDVEAQCLSPVSKIWAENEQIFAEELERIRSGPLEPIPWMIYVPKEPICPPKDDPAGKPEADKADSSAVFGPVTIAFPERALVKGIPPPAALAVSSAKTKEGESDLSHSLNTLELASPRVTDTPVLDTIAEEDEGLPGQEDVSTPTGEPMLCSCFSEDSIYSQPSADFSLSDIVTAPCASLPSPDALSAPEFKAEHAMDVPTIVLSTCASLPLPSTSTADDGLAALSAALGGTFLRVPSDDDDDDASPVGPEKRVVFGTVMRNGSRRQGPVSPSDRKAQTGDDQARAGPPRGKENKRLMWR